MLFSCLNKCVSMCLLGKLDFAADLILFPEYTIIIKINIIKNQSRVSYPFSEFVECRYGKGDTPLLHFLSMVVVWPYYAVALLPHLCHGHNCGSTNPLLKILRTGMERERSGRHYSDQHTVQHSVQQPGCTLLFFY